MAKFFNKVCFKFVLPTGFSGPFAWLNLIAFYLWFVSLIPLLCFCLALVAVILVS